MQQLKQKSIRKPFFNVVKGVLRIAVSRPKLIDCNESWEEGNIYLCNHVGSTVPLKLELYFPHNFKFWGTHEMTCSAKERYKYLANVYFLRKKHNSPFVSRIKAALSSTLAGCFYRGMQLLPTYTDARLIDTIKDSITLLSKGVSIVIFPEDSSNGYHDVLTKYYAGFLVLAKQYVLTLNKDLKIYNMYYRKDDNTLIVDKALSASSLLQEENIKSIAEQFRQRANALANIVDVAQLVPTNHYAKSID